MKALALLMACFSTAVLAEDIKVLSGGAARGFVEPLADTLPAHKVTFDFQTMGKLQQSLAAGATADLLIVTTEVLERLEKDGRIPAGKGTPLARVGIGVAVHERAPLPDISTADAMRRTLLAAKSVVYINPKTGTSGKYVEDMFAKLDILDKVRSKATLVDSGYAVEPVGRGEVELGIHQISEILPVKGVRLVGPLPAEFQRYTVYTAVPMNDRKSVKDLVSHLTGAQAREHLARAGYTPPQ
jgi:molybdate transport system substrate-binding protein